MRGSVAFVATVAAALPLLAGLVAPAPVGATPEPPLVVDVGADDGQVGLSPDTQSVRGGRVQWILTNGGDAPLVFALAVHDVVADDDGVRVGAPRPDLELDRDRVRLASGEAARIPLVLPDGPSTTGAIALVARAVDAEPETTLSGIALLAGGTGQVEPAVTHADADDGTFTIRLDSPQAALVDVAVRTSAWPGWGRTERVVEEVLVPAGGRDLVVGLGGPIAGRLDIDVAVSGDEGGRTSASVWWWPPFVVGALGLALAAAVGATAWQARRRRQAQVTVG